MTHTNVSMIENFKLGMAQIQVGKGADILTRLKTQWVLLFLAAAFMGLSAELTFGAGMESGAASTMSAKAADQGGPGAVPEQEEHGLLQSAARPALGWIQHKRIG